MRSSGEAELDQMVVNCHQFCERDFLWMTAEDQSMFRSSQ
jgi:hypothetical protein